MHTGGSWPAVLHVYIREVLHAAQPVLRLLQRTLVVWPHVLRPDRHQNCRFFIFLFMHSDDDAFDFFCLHCNDIMCFCVSLSPSILFLAFLCH